MNGVNIRDLRSLLSYLRKLTIGVGPKSLFRFKGDRIVGCVRDGMVGRFVVIQRERNGFTVAAHAEILLDGPLVKRLDKELRLTGEEVWITALPLSALLIRKMRIELTKDRAIDLALPFQVESRLPFPVEEAVIDWIPLHRDEKGSDLLVMATRIAEVAAHLNQWQQFGVDPHFATCSGLGLVHLVHYFQPGTSDCAMLCIGGDGAVLATVCDGELAAARHVDRVEVAEIARALLSMAAFRDLEAAPIFVVGGDPSLRSTLADWLNRPVASLPTGEAELEPFALALGTALSGGRLERNRVDFRQGVHQVRRPWWRLRKKLALFGALSCGLALALHLLGGRLLERAESGLRNDYLHLLALTGEEGAALPRRAAGIRSEVGRIERKVATSRDLFPLSPSLPCVSDLLVWLATQPALVRIGEGGVEPLIRIERVRYCLERYPSIKRPKERYQLRVELDFQAQSSTIAREFHDALLAPNEWVDPQVEVQWRSTPTGYRTSFCLRDRTFYPSTEPLKR